MTKSRCEMSNESDLFRLQNEIAMLQNRVNDLAVSLDGEIRARKRDWDLRADQVANEKIKSLEDALEEKRLEIAEACELLGDGGDGTLKGRVESLLYERYDLMERLDETYDWQTSTDDEVDQLVMRLLDVGNRKDWTSAALIANQIVSRCLQLYKGVMSND